MDIADFVTPSGRLVHTILGQRAFVPNDLPPDLDLSQIQQLLSDADQKLGELRGIGRYLQNPYLLIRPLQRKEAIASSNIEGTYTTLPELLLLESGIDSHSRTLDTIEVHNYIQSLHQGMSLLSEIPISTRLIHQLHKRLLSGLPKSRTGYFEPGQYRNEQNFIGKSKEIAKSRFNPPPPPLHIDAMARLEEFINSDLGPSMPHLVFLSIVHYQFETIHPFPDGNGRVGRLLIPLILKSRGIMETPLLYMSQYFEDNKDEYVDLMLKVSQKSQWIDWIKFFLEGVLFSCEKTIETIQKVNELRDQYQKTCHQARSSALLLKIIDSLFENIYTTVPYVRDMTQTSYTAAQNNINKLVSFGMLKEMKIQTRPKFYLAEDLMRLFDG